MQSMPTMNLPARPLYGGDLWVSSKKKLRVICTEKRMHVCCQTCILQYIHHRVSRRLSLVIVQYCEGFHACTKGRDVMDKSDANGWQGESHRNLAWAHRGQGWVIFYRVLWVFVWMKPGACHSLRLDSSSFPGSSCRLQANVQVHLWRKWNFFLVWWLWCFHVLRDSTL